MKLLPNIVKNPGARWNDLSSRLARWGLYVQGVLAATPSGYLPENTPAWVAVVSLALIQGAKLIAEDCNEVEDEDEDTFPS